MVIQAIITQYAEEAAFLWRLRDRAIHEPHYSLGELAKLDDRLEAHLDGLRIAGDVGWEICQESLSWQGTGESFAAAVLGCESGEKARIQIVLDIGVASPELSRSLVSALGWLSYQQAEQHIKQFLISASPDLYRIGI